MKGASVAIGFLADDPPVRVVHDAMGAPKPIGALVTRWAADPYARGSYSFLAVGSSPADLRALAEPVSDRLLFAGEATHQGCFATVHGAYMTGVREAQRILGWRSRRLPSPFVESEGGRSGDVERVGA